MAAHNRIDLTNKEFGNWLVISYVHTKNKQPFWNCLCRSCNKIFLVGSNSLRNKSKSCLKCRKTAEKEILKNPEDVIYRQIFARYRNEALRRKLPFKITYETAVKFFKSDCFYCNNGPISYSTYLKHTTYYMGIDRVDNAKGYVNNNIVPCCKPCNNKKFAVTKSQIATLYSLLYETENIPEDDFLFDPDADSYLEL